MQLSDMTIAELRSALDKGETSPLEVTTHYIDQIQKLDPEINAFITYNFEPAIEKAKSLTNSSGERDHKGLWGIPYALKDNICTYDIRTTCSSQILSNFTPKYSAHVYENLQSDDAILLGKVDLDEFAMGTTNENSTFGTVRNPHDLTRVPGGSSGASAAATASRIVRFALGSDTGGSVRTPASFCGITGFKPTYGTVSRYGLIAYASSLDQIGTLTTSIEDSAYVMNTIAGHDKRDSTSLNSPRMDYVSFLKKGIKGVKIGVDRDSVESGLEPCVKQTYLSTIDTFQKLGAEIIDVHFSYLDYVVPVYYLIACSEASSNLARFDGIRYGVQVESETSDETVIASRTSGFGSEVKNRIMIGTYALSAGYYDMYYNKALKVRRLIKEDLDNIFASCDAYLCPTTTSPALPRNYAVDDPLALYLADIFTVTANLAGIPAVSFPAGFEGHLPIGMQLYTSGLNEQVLFNLIHTFQSETDYHTVKPRFIKEGGSL